MPQSPKSAEAQVLLNEVDQRRRGLRLLLGTEWREMVLFGSALVVTAAAASFAGDRATIAFALSFGVAFAIVGVHYFRLNRKFGVRFEVAGWSLVVAIFVFCVAAQLALEGAAERLVVSVVPALGSTVFAFKWREAALHVVALAVWIGAITSVELTRLRWATGLFCGAIFLAGGAFLARRAIVDKK